VSICVAITATLTASDAALIAINLNIPYDHHEEVAQPKHPSLGEFVSNY